MKNNIKSKNKFIVKKNSQKVHKGLISNVKTNRFKPRPKIHNTNGTVIVSHTEMLSELQSTWTFPDSGEYHLNPGDTNTFNWLGPIASRYEFYRVRRCEIKYESLCPNTTEGSIFMYVDYDSHDTPCINVQGYLNNECSADCRAIDDLVLKLNPSTAMSNHPWKKTRYLEDYETIDLSVYDFGLLRIAQKGATTGVGIFWISYEFEFKSPQVPMEIAQTSSYSLVSNADGEALNLGYSSISDPNNAVRIRSNLSEALGALGVEALPIEGNEAYSYLFKCGRVMDALVTISGFLRSVPEATYNGLTDEQKFFSAILKPDNMYSNKTSVGFNMPTEITSMNRWFDADVGTTKEVEFDTTWYFPIDTKGNRYLGFKVADFLSTIVGAQGAINLMISSYDAYKSKLYNDFSLSVKNGRIRRHYKSRSL